MEIPVLSTTLKIQKMQMLEYWAHLYNGTHRVTVRPKGNS
jgi:hypothetical protein